MVKHRKRSFYPPVGVLVLYSSVQVFFDFKYDLQLGSSVSSGLLSLAVLHVSSCSSMSDCSSAPCSPLHLAVLQVQLWQVFFAAERVLAVCHLWHPEKPALWACRQNWRFPVPALGLGPIFLYLQASSPLLFILHHKFCSFSSPSILSVSSARRCCNTLCSWSVCVSISCCISSETQGFLWEPTVPSQSVCWRTGPDVHIITVSSRCECITQGFGRELTEGFF